MDGNGKISLLDIYDQLLDDEKVMLSDSFNRIKEVRRGEYVLSMLPQKMQKYYVIHYSLMGENQGKFVGLVCRSCNKWIEYGHDETCPMNELFSNYVDYKKFYNQFINNETVD